VWGANLVDFLQAVYRRRARFAILFVSQYYAIKKWPRLERQTAQDRALEESFEYVLPVRLDSTELPGLHSTVGYVDARHVSPKKIVQLIREKLGSVRASTARSVVRKIPHTPEDIASLLNERRPGWEYALYAAVIRRELNSLEDMYRDHVIGFAPRGSQNRSDSEAADFIDASFASARGIMASFDRVLSAEAQLAAFGKPGESGDPDRIVHLAARFVTVYREMMEWSQSIRSLNIQEDKLHAAATLFAGFMDQSIEAIRSFARDFGDEVESALARIERGETGIEIQMVVTLDISDELIKKYKKARKRSRY